MSSKPKVIVIVGPTASGKSDFAVHLALERNGEIISADSRQVYRHLDIGTGKITEMEMRGVKHHMLDVVDPGEHFSVASYRRIAEPILMDILSRGKTPIICGGTGQYIDALIYDMEIPEVPPDYPFRKTLESKTSDELFSDLALCDPRRSKSIDSKNKVRIIRALEIARSLGTVPELEKPELRYDVELYLLSPVRDVLRERITKRLLARLDQGMLDECKALLTKGVSHDELDRLGLEYRYMSRFLKGEMTYEEFVKKLTRKIFQYAKRQTTWNKKYLPKAILIPVG